MANIKIPSVHLPGIKLIGELSEEQMGNVYAFLKKQENGVGPSKFISSFKEQLHLQDGRIAGAIYSFGQLLAYEDADVNEISIDLTESYQELSKESLTEEQRDNLTKRLINILSLSNFLVISNDAYQLLANYKSVTRTNISSDVRLLFNEKDFSKKNALLLHRLFIKFRFKDKSDSETFYLDNSDLLELKSQIEQSLAQEDDIRKTNDGTLNFIEWS